MKRILERL